MRECDESSVLAVSQPTRLFLPRCHGSNRNPAFVLRCRRFLIRARIHCDHIVGNSPILSSATIARSNSAFNESRCCASRCPGPLDSTT